MQGKSKAQLQAEKREAEKAEAETKAAAEKAARKKAARDKKTLEAADPDYGKTNAQLHAEKREAEKAEAETEVAAARAARKKAKAEQKALEAADPDHGKSKALLQAEEREAEKAEAEMKAAEERTARKKAAAEKKALEAADTDPGWSKSAALLQAESREAEKKAAEDKAARKKAAAEKKALEAAEGLTTEGLRMMIEERQKATDEAAKEAVTMKQWKSQKGQDNQKRLEEEVSIEPRSPLPVHTTKTKPTLKQEGLAIFDALSKSSDALMHIDVASWFLDQLKMVSETSKVGSLPLYKFAGAVTSASDTQRQTIATAALLGYGAMEAEQRAEVLKMVVQSAGATQPRTGQRESQHVVNLRAIIEAAKFDTMLAQDKESLVLLIQAHALGFANPVDLSEVLQHMSPEERRQLSGALVKAKLIPAEQVALIDEIVEPDGILDEVNTVSEEVKANRDAIWVVALLPPLEWICAKRWDDPANCDYSLTQWLHRDACLSLTTIFCLLVAYVLLAPAYDIISSDPTGALRRWRASADAGGDRDECVQNAFGMADLAYKLGIAAGVLAVLLSLASGAYSAWAILLLVRTSLLDGCVGVSIIFEGLVITLRFAFIVVVLYFIWRLVTLYQKHQKMDAPGYGSMDSSDSNVPASNKGPVFYGDSQV